jgi:hypothetical protein
LDTVEGKFQIFLILLAVLAGTALLARRIERDLDLEEASLANREYRKVPL